MLVAYRVDQLPDRDYSFFVHLVDDHGLVIGQADRTIATTRYPSGTAFVERFALAPFTDVPPGEYTLMAGIYSMDAGSVVPLKSNAAERVTLGSLTVQADTSLIKANGIDLAGGITFVGSSASNQRGGASWRPAHPRFELRRHAANPARLRGLGTDDGKWLARESMIVCPPSARFRP